MNRRDFMSSALVLGFTAADLARADATTPDHKVKLGIGASFGFPFPEGFPH